MLKKLLSVSGFTLASRVTGFARDALLAWTLGAGVLSDAFFVAFLFPNYFRAIFGEGTLNPAFLPRYAALRAKGEDERAATFANGVFAWQMMAQIALLVVAIIFMPLRSWSSSGTRSPPASRRASRREWCNSMSASSALASSLAAAPTSSITSRSTRIASVARSTRIHSSPPDAAYPSEYTR